MWLSLRLLMKEHFQFPCFGWILKVCIVFIVLTSTTSLACWGSGKRQGNVSKIPVAVAGLDDPLVVNLTGLTGPVEGNIKTAWNGWEPNDKTKKEWQEWYDKWLAENAKIKEDGTGGPGGHDFSAERGPGSRWPNLPGWTGLGAGSGGTPIPPWAYVPKNVGKPSICFLPPVRGTCKDEQKTPEDRWGYNPYMDECQKYVWSGCGGTRNKFTKKEKCEDHCARPPPPSCTDESDFADKSSKPQIND